MGKEEALQQRDPMDVELEHLRNLVASLDWYWNADDREISVGSPSEIYGECDPGEIVEIERGGVVEVRFYAWLPAAEDSDSDEDFVVDAPTLAEAKAQIAAEQARRAALQAVAEAEGGAR